LFDQLIGEENERLGGVEIYDKVKRGRMLHANARRC